MVLVSDHLQRSFLLQVKFPDGSICSMDDSIAEQLEDILDKRDDVSPYSFGSYSQNYFFITYERGTLTLH
jgi:hypothetical protein